MTTTAHRATPSSAPAARHPWPPGLSDGRGQAAGGGRGWRAGLASEHHRGYEAGGDGGPTRPDSTAATADGQEMVVALRSGVGTLEDVVDGVDPDLLDDHAVTELLRLAQRGMDRLDGLRCLLAGVRETRALRAAGPGRERQALRQTRGELQDELQITPSQAKKLGETGRQVDEAPQTGRSMRQGKLRPELAAIITDTLRWLDGPDRDRVEEQLLEAAATCNAIALGRLARRLLAETDHDAAMEAVRRRFERRSGKLVEQPDGMTDLFARFSGVEAELAHTTIHAFRRRDTAGERRSPEQATADALIDIFNAALRSREAPTQHGERPHVTITVAEQDLETGTGAAEGIFTGSIPAGEVQRLVRDAKLTDGWTMRIRGPDVIFDPPPGSGHRRLTSTIAGP